MAGFSKQKSYDKVDLDVNDDINELNPPNVTSANGNFSSFSFKKAQKTQQNNFLGMSRLRKAPPPPSHSQSQSQTQTPTTKVSPTVKEKHPINKPITPSTKKSNPTNTHQQTQATKKSNTTNTQQQTQATLLKTSSNESDTITEPKSNDNNTTTITNEPHTDTNNTNNTNPNGSDDKDAKQDITSPSMSPSQTSPLVSGAPGVPRNTSQTGLNKGNRSRRRAMFIDLTQISDGFDPNAAKDESSKISPHSPSTETLNSDKILSPKITVTPNELDSEKINGEKSSEKVNGKPSEKISSAEVDEEGSTDEVGSVTLSEDKKSSSKEQLFSTKVPKLSIRKKATRSIPPIKPPGLAGQAMLQQQGQQGQQGPMSPHTPKCRSDGFSVVMPEDFYDKILEAKYNEVVVDKDNDIVKVEGVSKIPQSESLDNVNDSFIWISFNIIHISSS